MHRESKPRKSAEGPPQVFRQVLFCEETIQGLRKNHSRGFEGTISKAHTWSTIVFSEEFVSLVMKNNP